MSTLAGRTGQKDIIDEFLDFYADWDRRLSRDELETAVKNLLDQFCCEKVWTFLDALASFIRQKIISELNNEGIHNASIDVVAEDTGDGDIVVEIFANIQLDKIRQVKIDSWELAGSWEIAESLDEFKNTLEEVIKDSVSQVKRLLEKVRNI